MIPASAIISTAVTAADFEELAALRIAAMRPSLEHLSRFDQARARERLWQSFYQEHTQFIIVEGHRIGSQVLSPARQPRQRLLPTPRLCADPRG